jgi:lipoprotein NlpD
MRFLALGLVALLLTACASALRWEGGSRDGQYQVRSGDTLYSIALRHDVDYRDLARWNGIGRNYLIKPGQTLRLGPPDGDRTATRTAESRGSDGAGRARGGDRSTSSRPAEPSPVPQTPRTPERSVGDWQWPLQGEIVRGFDLPSSKGLDIGAAEGSRVRAAAGGRVVYSGSALKGYGELIIVKHNETYLSAYGYNRRRLAEEGDEVTAGQVIAEVGTGPAQKSMLHFEIRKAGKPVDPLRLLPADG